MDLALLLLLPLAGGYFFCTLFNPTRHEIAREDGHRLYFRAVAAGALLFLFAILLRSGLKKFVWGYWELEVVLLEYVRPLLKAPERSETHLQLVANSFFTLILGYLSPRLFNKLPVFGTERWLAVATESNDMENLFHTAARAAKPLAFTMDSEKVYVGFIVRTFDPTRERKTIAIFPLMSGYRDEKKEVQFVTYYSSIFEMVQRGENNDHIPLEQGSTDLKLGHLTLDDFEVVLPVDKIAAVSYFDLQAYFEFQKLRRSKSEKAKRSRVSRAAE